MNDICYNTTNPRFFCFLLHNSSYTVAIAIIAFCDITQRFQSGSLSVIGSLTFLYRFALLLQPRLKLLHFFIQAAAFFVGFLNILCDLIIGFLISAAVISENLLLALETENPLTDLCLSDIKLFDHRIKALCFTLGSSTAVKDLNDLVLAILHSTGTFLYIKNDILKLLLFFP